jgi:hypothetical protein
MIFSDRSPTVAQRRALLSLVVVLSFAAPASAQFRRGIFAETAEITLSPIVPPALLLPPGTVELQVQNTSPAPARVVDRVRELLGRQLTDNDSRLNVVPSAGDFVVIATVTEWNESRRSSTKYVSEQRQIGTKQVRDKDGRYKTEPVYEYGHNEPSVVINGAAGLRVEVKRRAGGSLISDESARYTVQEEHLVNAGPPSRAAVEDMLIDNAVRRAAGRVSPGREPVRVLLARSDEVDDLNDIARNRRWQEWLSALEALKPHRDRKKDSSRLHNLAVAHEAIAYESNEVEDQSTGLSLAHRLVLQAVQQNPNEKYVVDAGARIQQSVASYARLAELYQQAKTITPARPASQRTATPTGPPPAAPVVAEPAATMTNKDVIDLRAAGLDDENLIAAINSAKTVSFDLSPAGLKTLLGAKVTNRVISAMRARAQ